MIQKINLKIILTVIFIIIGAYLIFEHCCESDMQNIPVGIKIESIVGFMNNIVLGYNGGIHECIILEFVMMMNCFARASKNVWIQ